MSNLDFEGQLERMFAQAAADDDDLAFARAVSRRLDRAWILRWALIGGLGLVGAGVAAVQLAESDIIERTLALSDQAFRLVMLSLPHDLPAWLAGDGAASGPQTVWVFVGVALIGLGGAAWRAVSDN